ncbi:MAG: hypothetical protein J4F35_18670, partial [Candidatus Latescibacteria bacterium]|nr:hypothetical protein [Candidatus Latescibacterota bacterium]
LHEQRKKQQPWIPDRAGDDKKCKCHIPAPAGVATPRKTFTISRVAARPRWRYHLRSQVPDTGHNHHM